MKSSSGAHYPALDHIRGFAAFLVFVWHFAHGVNGFPTPFAGAPGWGPLVLFDEGQVGVALFMTLSGYLFAKLLQGKRVHYGWFLWNRVLRLFPLLTVVMALHVVKVGAAAHSAQAAMQYALTLPSGFIYPTWPSGGWSIAVELHFYLLLPLLLYLRTRFWFCLPGALVLAVLLRAGIHRSWGEVQSAAYWTIIGRIDQFLLGILFYDVRRWFAHKHLQAALTAAAFITFYQWFDRQGGFYAFRGYPSTSKLWIFMPTIEGAAFAALIAWYDNSFWLTSRSIAKGIENIGAREQKNLADANLKHSSLTNANLKQRGGGVLELCFSIAKCLFDGGVALAGKAGEYSYSIYLMHFFVVFEAAPWIHKHLCDLSSLSTSLAAAWVLFVAMLPLGWLSMRCIEEPFLRLRRPYYQR